MPHNRKIIYLAGFLFTMPLALTSYINSSFLEAFINPKLVGVFYIVASSITVLAMLEMPTLLNAIGNRFTVTLFSLFSLGSLLVLGFGDNIKIVIPAFILYFISTNFIIASLDIFVENFSKRPSIGRLRGLFLTVLGSAWVISQMISGFIIDYTSYKGIYLLSALFMLVVCAIFLLTLRDFKDPQYRKIAVLKTIKTFVGDKHLSKVYLINFILKFFFAWMIIYTPIYLHQYVGFGWDKIGLIFTIMLLPFVILEYPLGELSDKIGERKMLIIGFIFSALFTMALPFLHSKEFYLWALVLFMTRVGAATIEVMSESYFFKYIKEEDADEATFFRNTTPLSFIIAPLLATPILLLLPSFEYLFFILGAVLLAGVWISLRLEDIR